MQRYIAFLDILGFQNFVRRTPLAEVTRRLSDAFQFTHFADCLGDMREVNGVVHPNERSRSVYRFSFSDSFVLATKDDSRDSLNSIIAVTFLYSRSLFAGQLPVRGAIVKGEADFVPGTDHIVGNGVLDAVELEKHQDWFGVMLGSQLGSYSQIRSQLDARVIPLIVPYRIPLKPNRVQPGAAINWRLNLWASLGVQTFFPEPADDLQRAKRNNALRFAKHVRDNGLSQTEHDRPWLLPVVVREMKEGTTEVPLVHGDEY